MVVALEEGLEDEEVGACCAVRYDLDGSSAFVSYSSIVSGHGGDKKDSPHRQHQY